MEHNTTTTTIREEESWQKNTQEHMQSHTKAAAELNRDLEEKVGVRLTKSSDDLVRDMEEEDELYIMSNPYLTLSEIPLREEVERRYSNENNIWKIAVSNVEELVRFIQRPPFENLEYCLQYYSREYYQSLGGFGGGGIINNILPDAVARLKPQRKKA